MKLNIFTRLGSLITFAFIVTNCSTGHSVASSNKFLSFKATSNSKIIGDILLTQQGRDVLF